MPSVYVVHHRVDGSRERGRGAQSKDTRVGRQGKMDTPVGKSCPILYFYSRVPSKKKVRPVRFCAHFLSIVHWNEKNNGCKTSSFTYFSSVGSVSATRQRLLFMIYEKKVCTGMKKKNGKKLTGSALPGMPQQHKGCSVARFGEKELRASRALNPFSTTVPSLGTNQSNSE